MYASGPFPALNCLQTSTRGFEKGDPEIGERRAAQVGVAREQPRCGPQGRSIKFTGRGICMGIGAVLPLAHRVLPPSYLKNVEKTVQNHRLLNNIASVLNENERCLSPFLIDFGHRRGCSATRNQTHRCVNVNQHLVNFLPPSGKSGRKDR